VRHIVVADQDPAVVHLIVETLRGDGHVVFPAYDADSASRVARTLEHCDLMISNTRVAGNADGAGLVDGVDLIAHLRRDRPTLPILYLANPGRSTPEMEAELPSDVPILRVPFTAGELRAKVQALLTRPTK
jgi:DNA-binding response OmpR family regulator